MYLPYTCAGDSPDHEAAMPARGRCEPDARSADTDLAKNDQPGYIPHAGLGFVPAARRGAPEFDHGRSS